MFNESGGGHGGKRQTDFELNLVPFIDLMSTCISFLLITAVWTQVSMIQIGSSIYSKKSAARETEPPKKDEINLKVDVTHSGYTINLGHQAFSLPKANGVYDDAALVTQLKDIKGKYPEKLDAIISLLDDIKYDELIKGMDSLMTAGFPEVAIAATGAQ
jgi:biopolymer transport protein TolR